MTMATMAGKTCLITGATSGLGRAAALELGRLGARLILVGRNARRGRKVVERLQAGASPGKATFLQADLSSQAQVRVLAQKVRERHERIDVLINNAGARFDVYGQTLDGLERTFATNHLGHFLLTCLLLDPLRRASSARVVTVSSGSHTSANCDGDWQFKEENYDRRIAYAKSKLANVLFSLELARRLRETAVSSNAIDPGGVASRFAQNNGFFSWLRHLVAHGLCRQLVLPRTGARAIVSLAAAEEWRGVSGEYFVKNRQAAPHPCISDPEAARQLWSLSVRLTSLGPEMGPGWEWVQPWDSKIQAPSI